MYMFVSQVLWVVLRDYSGGLCTWGLSMGGSPMTHVDFKK